MLATDYLKNNKIPWTIIEPNPSTVDDCPAKIIKGFFDDKFSIDEKIDTLFSVIAEVRGMVQASSAKNNDRLISWGLGVLGFLVATVGWLVSHYVLIK